MSDFQFSPAVLLIPAGSSVTWRFDGPSPHSSTSSTGSPTAWDSGVLSAGGQFTRRFDTPGNYPYHCSVHPAMTGMVVVGSVAGH